MEKEIKEHLINFYNQLDYKGSSTCIKYRYIYNDVNVNIFFDAYDISSVSLSMILVLNSDYYYTSLNIDDTSIRIKYLRKLPQGILNKILVDSHLNIFYEKMEEHILADKPYVDTYSRDKLFFNTMKWSRNDTDYPFWYHLRNVRMSDDTVNRLNASGNIPIEILRKIQEKNFTIVRTDKPERRKELTVILDTIGIKLN